MQCTLTDKKCEPCHGGVPPLTQQQINDFLAQTPEWLLSDDKKSIYCHLKFKNFSKVMGFVNVIAWVAQQEGHHPDVKFGYDYCDIVFTTHAIDGLSENDFICAAKINQLLG